MALRINPLRFLATVQPPPPAQLHRMATVVQASPLAIQFDGETPYFYDAIPAITAALVTGQRVIVVRIANAWVITNLVGLIAPFTFDYPTSYTSWTTVWTTSTGANTPSRGNGVFTVRYVKLGALCSVTFSITMGTLTNFNGGGAGDNWQFSLPFAAVTSGGVGSATFNSASTTVPLQVLLTAGNSFFTLNMSGAGVSNAGASLNTTNGGAVDAVTPYVWTASSANQLLGSFTYEV